MSKFARIYVIVSSVLIFIPFVLFLSVDWLESDFNTSLYNNDPKLFNIYAGARSFVEIFNQYNVWLLALMCIVLFVLRRFIGTAILGCLAVAALIYHHSLLSMG